MAAPGTARPLRQLDEIPWVVRRFKRKMVVFWGDNVHFQNKKKPLEPIPFENLKQLEMKLSA